MGGWNIFYALLNFAILLAGLYFVGRKLVKKMYDNHRSKVAEDLQRSAAAAENAIQLEKDAERLSADGQRECREIIADAERRVGGGDARKRQLESNFEQELCHELDLERQRLLLEERRRLNRKEADRLIELAGQKMRRPEWSEARAAFKKSYTARLRRAFALSAGELVRISDQGELRAQLRTAEPVDIDTVLVLDGLIIEALNNAGVKISESDIHVDTKVDADIIGGFSLQIGDTVFDGTIRNLLERSHEDIAGMEDLRGDFIECLKKALSDVDNGIDVYQIGHVTSASDGICRVSGLSDAMAGEMLRFEGGLVGMVMDLEQDNIGVVLLGEFDHVQEGDRVRCTGRIIEVPVGEELMGRVVDALGRPLDGRGAINTGLTRPIESPAPGVISRQGVSVPMATGIKAIDALVPIGRGQRELIIGDRQTGKTAIALDAIINQKGKDVICIYVAVGQKESTVAGVYDKLKAHGAMDYTTIVCASASEPAPMLYIAPYAGTAMGEYFMYRGRDVLIVYDDLSKQAVAYREISLLLHRPPGREAYPGDVFYLHSRLLERSARLSGAAGGGSMTALPIIETQAGDISAYIPTNDISITDGQIFLETELFNSGVRPAVNVGLSVSRVGGAAQLGAVKQVAGRLRMQLAQYRELAAFSQFGFDLDKATQETLNRGDRMTELLKQNQYSPMSAVDQVIAITAVSEGYTDTLPVKDIPRYEAGILPFVHERWPELTEIVNSGAKLSKDELERLRGLIVEFGKEFAV